MEKNYKQLIFKGIVIALLSMGFSVQAQEECLSDILHQRMMASNSSYAAQMAINENALQKTIALKSGTPQLLASNYRIPIVVHVIHLGEPVGVGSNISDAQIYSAIRTLNEAYRKKAATEFFANGVDTQIEFCLAQKDVSGNPSTGIIRMSGFATSDYATNGITTAGSNNEAAIKALSKWDNTKYYNVWIVAEIDNNNAGSGTQGYAYFPGASSSVDGAVILYNSFGYDPTGQHGYNLKSYTSYNKTFIHEMGHALSLYHTFQGDAGGTGCPTDLIVGTSGDGVSDTPKHIRSADSCVADATVNSCQAGTTAGDYQHNYMDYSADACMNMYTAGQSTRMNATLTSGGPRASLTTPANLTACGCDIPVALFSASSVNPCLGMPVQFTDESLNFPTSWEWTFTGAGPANATDQNPTTTYNAGGAFDVTLKATSATGINSTFTRSNYINPIVPATLPFSEDFEGGTFPPTGWGLVSFDSPSVAWGDGGIHQWEQMPAMGNTGSETGAAAINMYDYDLIGSIDALICKPVSLAGTISATMTFKVAYKNYPILGYEDSLRVFISTDCGNTFSTAVYSKSGDNLATNGASSSDFTPLTSADWRTETINLNAYIGQTVIAIFESTNNYGNNLYIDDVKITGTFPVASTTITSSDVDAVICRGTSVTYTANATNGGSAPVYQWKINGADVLGANASTYTTDTLKSGQTVSCILTSNLLGVTNSPTTSNNIVMTVTSLPATPTASNTGSYCEGATISLSAPIVADAKYNWTGPNAFVSATQNPTRSSSTLAMAGTYSLTVKDTITGCTSLAGTTAVVVNAAATPSITQGGSTLSSSSLINNQWYLEGVLISGAIGQNYVCTQNGAYTVVVTNGSCSSAPSAAMTIINAGLEETNNPNSSNIYPNPNDGNFMISFDGLAKANYKLELTNIFGQLVYRDELKEFSGTYKKQLSIVDYGKGVYTMTLSNDKSKVVKKIIVR